MEANTSEISNIRLPWVAKATPLEDGGNRYLYIEASNETPDLQGEKVLLKALQGSVDHYLRSGNVDLYHRTMNMPGRPGDRTYEIGRPVEVRFDSGLPFVKCELYRGDSPMAKNADLVWQSITQQTPPAHWFPSVGGAMPVRKSVIDPETGRPVTVVESFLWNNIGLDPQPINTAVPEVSTAPIGAFAKSLGAFVVGKALEAGYGTDSAALSGGSALRVQSLDGAPKTARQDGTGPTYADMRNQIAVMVRAGRLDLTQPEIQAAAASLFGLTRKRAAQFAHSFLSDLARS